MTIAYIDAGSGPGWAQYAHLACAHERGRLPLLPRRVRRDAIQAAVEGTDTCPEVRATLLAALPQVPEWDPEQVREGLRRIAGALSRLVEDER